MQPRRELLEDERGDLGRCAVVGVKDQVVRRETVELSRQSSVVVEVPSQRTMLVRGVSAPQSVLCHFRRRSEVHDPQGDLEALFVAFQVIGLGDHSRDDRRSWPDLPVVPPHCANVVSLGQDVLRVSGGRRP